MRGRALALIALTLGAGVLTVLAQAESSQTIRPANWATLAFARSDVVGGGIGLVGAGRVTTQIPGGIQPAWSPDGRRLAYIAPGAAGAADLFVTDADGTHRGRITDTPDVDEASPSWAPDGDRLVVEAAGKLIVHRADGHGGRFLTNGRSPAWSPGGRRIVYERDGDLFVISTESRRPRRLTGPSPSLETEPAWSPEARRIVYASDESGVPDLRILNLRTGTSSAVTADDAVESWPAFTSDGRSIVFGSDRSGVEALWRVATAGGIPVPIRAPPDSTSPRPRPRRQVAELPPDFDQQAPSDLEVRPSDSGFRLWFTSAADNVGLGPFVVNGRRRRAGAEMRAYQRVRLGNGAFRTYPDVGVWRYNSSPDHAHWHLLSFQRYELRRADGKVVVRDRKSGFCIGDRYGVAPGRVEHRIARPVFRGYCNLYQPNATAVDAGTSVGFSDRYHSRLDGQNLDLTRVRAGRYLLVNRANPSGLIRELRYENNAAAVAIRVTWPRGRRAAPEVRVLAVCPDSASC
jgi:Lysyl oxidase/WD40-like Beta Propeller Repeat